MGTVRPRLDAAGADQTRVHGIEGHDDWEPDLDSVHRWSFRGDCDIYEIESYLKGLEGSGQPVRLIVIDSIAVFLDQASGRSESNLRGMIAKLADLAARSGAAILLVSHPPKSGVGKRGSWWPLARHFAEAARSIWMIVRDAQEPQRRMLLPVKTNLCETPAGRAFSIRNDAILWEREPVPISAEQFLDQSTEQRTVVLDWRVSKVFRGRRVSSPGFC
jgi:putative DNA primase/helicase